MGYDYSRFADNFINYIESHELIDTFNKNELSQYFKKGKYCLIEIEDYRKMLIPGWHLTLL